jgi:hypothetical protein
MPLLNKRKPTAWWKETHPKEWHTHKSLSNITISLKDGQPIAIGEGYRKVAYHGYAFFKNGTTHSKVPIVIKKFKEPLSAKKAGEYNKLITFLRESNFPVPKSGLVKVTPAFAKTLGGIAKPGDWVAIQQFFGKKQKTHIVDRLKEVDLMIAKFMGRRILRNQTDFSLLFLGKKIARTDAIKLFAKLVNLEITPKFDAIAPLRVNNKVIGAIPFDLDLIIEEISNTKRKPTSPELAIKFLEIINSITQSKKERLRLFEIGIKEISSNEVKQNLLLFKTGYLFFEKKNEIEKDFFSN